MMNATKKAKLVAKVLKGPPYEIENMEEFVHFFGKFCPDNTLEEAIGLMQLKEGHVFEVRVEDKDA